MRMVIIGGSDAGISAALRVRELDPAATISVLLADSYPNYSVCGLPFYLSGEVQDWQTLSHRTGFEGIQVLTDCTAEQITTRPGEVLAKQRGRSLALNYERLLIATGASPVNAEIAGHEISGVFFLRTMDHALALKEFIGARRPSTALIVGGGYIGVEMADALTRRGIRVTIVTSSPAVLSTVEPHLGAVVEAELDRNGVRSVGGTSIERIERRGEALRCVGNGFEEVADLVLIAAGVAPNTSLAKSAGIELGARGAIRVDRMMHTNIPDIYAAGDCVETWHQLLGKPTYLPLGTTAHKQGRVAGENIAGGQRQFEGSLGTQVVKVFDLAVARSGLLESEAREAGFDPLTCECSSWDHNRYYPGAEQITIRLTADVRTDRLLGVQMVGHWRTQVAKRIDVIAAALRNSTAVGQLDDLDLSYTPPLGTLWDAVQLAGHRWLECRSQRNR